MCSDSQSTAGAPDPRGSCSAASAAQGRAGGGQAGCMLTTVAVQSLSHVKLFTSPWTVARQASLSSAISQSLVKLMSIESVMPSNHLILCCPLLFLSSIFPSIRVFSSESAHSIRWPNYRNFSFTPFNEYSGLISLRNE